MKKAVNRQIIFLLLAGIAFWPGWHTGVAGAQPTPDWIARYDGTGNGDDEAVAIATDSSSNIYVTGTSAGNGTGEDIVTIKYDSTGTELWVAQYNGPGSGDDEVRDIEVDSAGNIYVAGQEYAGSNDYDYVIIKYDTNGNMLWTAHHGSYGPKADDAATLAVDSAGNVYITGTKRGITDNYGTLKYDSSGNQLWLKHYDRQNCYGSNGCHDTAVDIVVDGTGNVYVTGYSQRAEANFASTTTI